MCDFIGIRGDFLGNCILAFVAVSQAHHHPRSGEHLPDGLREKSNNLLDPESKSWDKQSMNYTTAKNSNGETEIVMFVVVATAKGGYRLPWLKTFSPDEAIVQADAILAENGHASNVKIEEFMLSKLYWEFKFKTPWPLT